MRSPSPPPSVLLLVESDPGAVDTDAFHRWYDGEHVPARMALPGFRSGTRYRATDGAPPGWLALYDVDPRTLESAAYRRLRSHRSEAERLVMQRLAVLRRRVLTVERHQGAAPAATPYLMSVGPGAAPDRLGALPGWVSTTRYAPTGADAEPLTLVRLLQEPPPDPAGRRFALWRHWPGPVGGTSTIHG
ncbi:hypothetical protein ABZX40_33560 [Streptomyces sp. NPDC004610]|uniref:hypothetical protein n=1 Tax=unclassified Streptomyces TaxID=2593676 RepID=UPI0033BC633F